MSVHNHPPYRPVCNERRVNGQLRGACLTDEGDPVSDTKPDLDAIERLRGAIREAANYAEADEVAQTESGAAILHTLGEALRADLDDATDRDDLLALLPPTDWEIVARSMMAKVREIEAWQDSVNRERRKDRARAEAAEAERDQLRDTLELRSAAHNRLAQRLDQVRALADSWAAPQRREPGWYALQLRRVLDGEFGALVGGDQRTENR